MLLAVNWSEEEACRRMEALRDELIAMKYGDEVTYRHSISYGVVEAGANNNLSAGELLRIADEKMYAYKRIHKIPPSVSLK